MSTLLLVSGENGSEASSAADRSAPRRGPTLKASLERVGYEVVQVQDGAAALMRVGRDRPDLIVMAGIVPDMELVDLCTSLRRDPIAEKVPFVLVAEAAARTGRRPRVRARISCFRPAWDRPRSPTDSGDSSRPATIRPL